MANQISVQAEDFDAGAEIAALQRGGDVGAVASFVGYVRADGGVTALELEHYPGMTEASIGDIIAEWLAFLVPAVAIWFGYQSLDL